MRYNEVRGSISLSLLTQQCVCACLYVCVYMFVCVILYNCVKNRDSERESLELTKLT